MKRAHDEGSILVLGIGLAITCLMLATVVIDVASLWIARSNLNSIADGAALAGSQAIDVTSVYTGQWDGSAHLNPALARTRVRNYVRQPEVASQVRGLAVRSVTVSGNSVQVLLSAKPDMPFRYLWDGSTIVARSKARASVIVH